MAEEKQELDGDLDLDAKPAKSKKKLIILSIVGLLIIAISVGVTLMLLGGDEPAAEGEVVEEPEVATAHYLPLQKMVVNFAQKGSAKYLQVEMELMAHDEAVLEVVKQHMPVVKNDLLVLLSTQSAEQLRSLEGKEALREEVLKAVRKIVKQNAGLDGPQAVYFTSFVMQ